MPFARTLRTSFGDCDKNHDVSRACVAVSGWKSRTWNGKGTGLPHPSKKLLGCSRTARKGRTRKSSVRSDA